MVRLLLPGTYMEILVLHRYKACQYHPLAFICSNADTMLSLISKAIPVQYPHSRYSPRTAISSNAGTVPSLPSAAMPVQSLTLSWHPGSWQRWRA